MCACVRVRVCISMCARAVVWMCVHEGIAGGMAVLGVGVALGSLYVSVFESKREDSMSVQICGYMCLVVCGYVASGCNNIFLLLSLTLSDVL